MVDIYEALESVRANAASEKDKGTGYERLSRYYLNEIHSYVVKEIYS